MAFQIACKVTQKNVNMQVKRSFFSKTLAYVKKKQYLCSRVDGYDMIPNCAGSYSSVG